MLARISGGKSGVVEYLKNGMKQGRNLSRDELDCRIVIDGNLEITDSIIKQLEKTKGNNSESNNYLHITLSFSEKDLTDRVIENVYNDYKSLIMNAYDDSEFNIYAEIHKPKIKSYEDARTGEVIERLPHVHIVIPTTNLVTNLKLDPYGRYNNNIPYLEAIQEKINRKYNLDSTFDHQREKTVFKSDILSRYKGDNFKGANKELKNNILDVIHNKNIRDTKHFELELLNFGEVSKGKVGCVDEYYKLKPEGKAKSIRLKDPCFKKDYIENRSIKREKPSDNKVLKLIDDWVNEQSHYNKLIHTSSPKIRKQFNSLNTKNERQDYLNEQRQQYTNRYFPERRRASNIKFGSKRVKKSTFKTFADQDNSLSGLRMVNVANNSREAKYEPENLLSNTSGLHLVEQSTRGKYDNRELRRIDVRRGIGYESNSIPTQLLNDHINFSHVKNNIYLAANDISSKILLEALTVSHGLNLDHYHSTSVNKQPLIAVCGNCYSHANFLKQHMGLTHNEASSVIATAKSQLQDDDVAFNTIFASRKSVGDIENDFYTTFTVLSKLKTQEKTMDNQSDNTFFGSDITSLKNVVDHLSRQQQLADQLTTKYSELITKTSKDDNNKIKKIDFHNRNGDKVFTDTGTEIRLARKDSNYDNTAMALELATEKFGSVNIKGTAEFKQNCIDCAIAKDLKIIFADKSMQRQFLEQKASYNSDNQNVTQQQQPDAVGQIDKDEIKERKEVLGSQGSVLLEHGRAKYRFDESESMSYFAKMDDGRVVWGKDIGKALSEADIEVGDRIELGIVGKENVKTMANVRDKNNNVIGKEEISTQKNVWKATKFDVENVKVSYGDSASTNKATVKTDSDTYHFSYKYDSNAAKLALLVNDKPLSESDISDASLMKIAKKDKFLKTIPLDEIKAGFVSLRNTTVHPEFKTYDANAKVVKTQSKAQTQTL